jgi:serine/threonine protein phosphatase PrpC
MSTVGPFITTCARTDVGMRRDNNEDAFLLVDLDAPQSPIACDGAQHDIAHRRMLLAVSDGMGGHAAGEVASSLALSELAKALVAPSKLPLPNQLEAAVQTANRAVITAAADTNRHGMGATLTAVLLVEQTAWIAEVGDSRAYLLRNGRLRQLTKDQSFVQMLVDTGTMTEEEAKESSRRNVILQAVGTENKLRVELGRLEMRRGDRLLLCSDGLTNEVDDNELAALLSKYAPSVACEHAIQCANKHGGKDNVTAIVAVLDGEALPAPKFDETITGTHHVIQQYYQR